MKPDPSQYALTSEVTGKATVPVTLRISKTFFDEWREDLEGGYSSCSRCRPCPVNLGRFDWERCVQEVFLPKTEIFQRGYVEVREVNIQEKLENGKVCLDCILVDPRIK